MRIDLKDAEKIALANFLAERTTKRLVHSAAEGIRFTERSKEKVRKSEYKFFKKCLDETNDY